MHFVPYLVFDGRCAEAMRFYADVLGGRLETLMTHRESPIAGEVPPEWGDLVMHANLVVDDARIMASDSPPEHYEQPGGSYVSIQLADVADAERIWNRLAEGAEVKMPLDKTFWAERFGMLVDRYGTRWMINCEVKSAVPA